MNPSVLIADDEPLARRTLKQHLIDLGWTGSILEARDGAAAIEAANSAHPALMFLDIVMPGATGIQVLEQLDYEPKVIFTTAYDRYAVTAFELGAIDYLLKPFGRERLARVVERTRIAISASAAPVAQRAKESLETGRTLSRIFVRDGSRIVPIDLHSIERVQGADDYVMIFSGDKPHLVNVRLSELEEQLRGENFIRIHRSHLVNLEYISSIERYDGVRAEVVTKSGARIIASRAGSQRLRKLAL